jgi:hypothetical protein
MEELPLLCCWHATVYGTCLLLEQAPTDQKPSLWACQQHVRTSAKGSGKVETEAIHMVLIHPMLKAVNNLLCHGWVIGTHSVATAAVVQELLVLAQVHLVVRLAVNTAMR